MSGPLKIWFCQFTYRSSLFFFNRSFAPEIKVRSRAKSDWEFSKSDVPSSARTGRLFSGVITPVWHTRICGGRGRGVEVYFRQLADKGFTSATHNPYDSCEEEAATGQVLFIGFYLLVGCLRFHLIIAWYIFLIIILDGYEQTRHEIRSARKWQ